jgi:hypothetical protein
MGGSGAPKRAGRKRGTEAAVPSDALAAESAWEHGAAFEARAAAARLRACTTRRRWRLRARATPGSRLRDAGGDV